MEVPLWGTILLDTVRTKLRPSTMVLHGLTNEVGSSTRPASTMLTQLWFHFGVSYCGKQKRADFEYPLFFCSMRSTILHYALSIMHYYHLPLSILLIRLNWFGIRICCGHFFRHSSQSMHWLARASAGKCLMYWSAKCFCFLA